jgi:hypothetical protein
VVIGGLATLAVVAFTGWALPSLRRLGPIDASAGEAEAAA